MSKINSNKNNLNEDRQLRFHEALSFIVESSNINGGTVSLDEIHSTFNDIIEDESMYQYIYDYLLENKIAIRDYLPHMPKTTEISRDISPKTDLPEADTLTHEEERKFVELYLKEVNAHPELDKTEELELLKLLYDSTSEDMCKNTIDKLVEGNLRLVISAAENYKNNGVTMGDLIQEGNLGLIEGVSTYFSDYSEFSISLLEFHDYLTHCISRAIADAINEQNTSSRVGRHLADNANRLDKASIELSQDLDRTPTIQELSKYLSIPEDEIERIMKMSLDALTVDNAEGAEQ